MLTDGLLPLPTSFTRKDDWFLDANGTHKLTKGDPELLAQTQIADEGSWALLWLMQALAILLLVIHLAITTFQPLESLNIRACAGLETL